jgi:hypothetical protein
MNAPKLGEKGIEQANKGEGEKNIEQGICLPAGRQGIKNVEV